MKGSKRLVEVVQSSKLTRPGEGARSGKGEGGQDGKRKEVGSLQSDFRESCGAVCSCLQAPFGNPKRPSAGSGKLQRRC